MLGVPGEVTDHGIRTRHGYLRIELAVTAGTLWPSRRERVRAVAGSASPARDGFGSGTLERFLDGRAWLDTLDDALTALPNVARTGPGALGAPLRGGREAVRAEKEICGCSRQPFRPLGPLSVARPSGPVRCDD